MVGHRNPNQLLTQWGLLSILVLLCRQINSVSAYCYNENLEPIDRKQTEKYAECMYSPTVVETGQIYKIWNTQQNKVTTCLNNKACFAACNLSSCMSLGFAQEIINANMWMAKVFCSMALAYLLISVVVVIVLIIRVGFKTAECNNKINEIVEKSVESFSSDHESDDSVAGGSLADVNSFSRLMLRRSHLQESLLIGSKSGRQ
jgi:hypothetical protein